MPVLSQPALRRRAWILLLPVAWLGVLFFIFRERPGTTPHLPDPAGAAPSGDVDWRLVLDLSRAEIQGVWCVALSFFTVIVCFSLTRVTCGILPSKLSVYRPYEKKLLNKGRLMLRDVLDYHSQYHWGDYAAICIGIVLLTVSMLSIERSNLTDTGIIVQAIAVCAMTIASTLLCWADLVHTNSQTPIIPIHRRFVLIDFSVQSGTLGVMLMLHSVFLFVALISLPVTVACCALYLGVFARAYWIRRVHKRELFEYFDIHDTDGWEQADHEYIQTLENEVESTYKDIPYALSEHRELYRNALRDLDGEDDPEGFLGQLRLYLRISPQEHVLLVAEEEEARRMREVLRRTIPKGISEAVRRALRLEERDPPHTTGDEE